MTVRRPLFEESFLRAFAVLGAAALVLALLPATAQAQEEDFDPTAACPVDAPESDFDDRDEVVPEDHVQNVDCGAFFDIVLGFEDGTFGPTLPVKRDQMASFIARTLDAADVELPDADEGEGFDDVADGNVHRDNILRLQAAGIALGGPLGAPEGEFGPSQSIRRDQMVSFVVRAAEFAYGEDFDSSEQQFDDVGSDNVHFENINFGGEVGLVQGRTADTFDPGAHTRRDQTSAFVVRLLNFLTTPAEVAITEQSAEQATVGETITVTATVFSQFRDEAAETASDTDSATLEGVEVTFEGEHEDDAGQVVPPGTQTEETNEDGEASFDVTAASPGTVTITASIDGPGGTFVHADGDSDSVEKEFVVDPAVEPGGLPDDEQPPADDEEEPADDEEEPADDEEEPADDEDEPADDEEPAADALDLAPETATNFIGQEHTATATVTAEGDPVEGEDVRFEIYRETDTVGLVHTEEGTTDTAGQTALTYTYLGPEPAEDTIVACTLGDAEPEEGESFCAEVDADTGEVTLTQDVADQAEKTWQVVPEGPPVVIEANQSDRATGRPEAGKNVRVRWNQPVVPGDENPEGYELFENADCDDPVNTGEARDPAQAADDEVFIQFEDPVGGGERWLGVQEDTERSADDDTPNEEQCVAMGPPRAPSA